MTKIAINISKLELSISQHLSCQIDIISEYSLLFYKKLQSKLKNS
ncbi:hypothetical protein Palpr_2311 [Paludibacter propionicigenes WB4]|uniref:Uncharacterized protein n=1 Tax=Paludibacter propionicigenes (strain DSM 17365 / JCM 13257 / WB4) TaxID=694427 RepID=E4T6V3_PALPW|nr:hypothetical protein Palpr_2311 [Paludibacter propionicigenes WB4]